MSVSSRVKSEYRISTFLRGGDVWTTSIPFVDPRATAVSYEGPRDVTVRLVGPTMVTAYRHDANAEAEHVLISVVEYYAGPPPPGTHTLRERPRHTPPPADAIEWTCPKCKGDALVCGCYLTALAQSKRVLAGGTVEPNKRGIRFREDE